MNICKSHRADKNKYTDMLYNEGINILTAGSCSQFHQRANSIFLLPKPQCSFHTQQKYKWLTVWCLLTEYVNIIIDKSNYNGKVIVLKQKNNNTGNTDTMIWNKGNYAGIIIDKSKAKSYFPKRLPASPFYLSRPKEKSHSSTSTKW